MGVRSGCGLNENVFRGLRCFQYAPQVAKLFDEGSLGESMAFPPVAVHLPCCLLVVGVISQAPCPGLLPLPSLPLWILEL